MIRTILGALIGGEIDRKRRDGGLTGALIGALAMRVVPRMGPFGLALGGAYVAKKAYDRYKERRAAAPPAAAKRGGGDTKRR